MTNLNYSSFMQLVHEHYSYDIEKEVLARLLLESITSSTFHPKFSSPYLSYIWNGHRNVTKALISETEKPIYKKACYNHFSSVILKELSPHLLEDFLNKLSNLVSGDSSITQSKKDNLHVLLSSKDYAKYLTDTFLYALKKPNKGVVTKIGPDDVDLLQETDQKCALCRLPLVEYKSKNSFFRYTITSIFPENLDVGLEYDFDRIHKKPRDLQDKTNQICLCDSCGSDYIYSPDLITYDKLFRIKWRFMQSGNLKKSTSPYHLEQEIVDILENIKIANYDDDSFKKLRMKPIKITNKIYPDNHTLIKAIKDDVDVYYYYVKELLITLDEYSTSFKQIALEVKTCFLSVSKSSIDQFEVFNSLVQWILDTQHLPESYREAAHIVISYFVQNCEVFDEISE